MNKKQRSNHEEYDESIITTGLYYPDTYYNLSSSYRSIVLNENITLDTSTELSSMLMYYNNISKKEPIMIYLNSNGGDALALLNMYDMMKLIKAPIHTVCMGKCYSAAAVILSGGKKGHRSAMKNSKIMMHGLQCNFPLQGDTVLDSKTHYGFIQNANKTVMKILARNTGKKLKEIEKDCSRDYWMSATQAKTYGLIDHVI